MSSCNEKSRNDMNTKILYPINELSGSINANDIFCEFEYISLETTQQSLLGSVDRLIVYDDKLFVLDKAYSNKIFVFTKDGEFIRTIGKVGKGPEEYTNIEDFTINEDTKDINVLCYPSTVFIYNMKGNFIRRKKLASSALLWNISWYKDGYICSSNHQSVLKGKEAFLLFYYSLNFNIQKKMLTVLPKQVTLPPLISNPLLRNGDSLAYFDFFTSTLYRNVTGTDFNSIQFNFEGNEVPIELYANSQEFFNKQREYCFFLDAIFFDNVFLSYFIYKGKQNVLRLDFDKNKKIVSECEKWFPRLLFYRDSYFYSFMNPHWITKGHKFFNANNVTEYPIEANSNPVILRFKAKTLLDK